MSLSGMAVLIGVLLLFVGIWWGLSFLMTTPLRDPDGHAKVTGNCGDTMEFAFKLEHGVVERTHTWTDGCATSRSCIDAAARLAYGKNCKQLGKISMMDVIEELGSLPETHLHCAQLAETTLHHAVQQYHREQSGQTGSEDRQRGDGSHRRNGGVQS